LPNVKGVGNGLSQYYGLEEETDEFSFNTGRVMAKVGWNDEKANIEKIPVTFVIVDNKPHLTELGVSNLLKRTEKLILVTTNKENPAYKFDTPTLMDGESLKTSNELKSVKALELMSADKLDDSYLHLLYKVIA
jgi:hypothetical protein